MGREDGASGIFRDRENGGESAGRVGICVSGGGLRAASFGLGALQALQERRGLLRGRNAARYLSAVSGGSYIAGAYTLLNCGDRVRPFGQPEGAVGSAPGVDRESPFAPGSKEAEHLRRHCRYMVEDGGLQLSAVMAGLMVFNLIAVAAIVGFAGVYLGEVAILGSIVLPHAVDSPDGLLWLQWPIAVLAAAAIYYLVHDFDFHPAPGTGVRVPVLVAAAFAFIGSSALVCRLETIPILRNPDWVADHGVAIAAGLAILVALVTAATLLSRRYRHLALLQRLGTFGTGLLTLRLVQAIGLLTISWLAVLVYQQYRDPEPSLMALAAVAVTFVAPFVITFFVDRASPHLIYRDLLNRCFSVVRNGADVLRPHDPRAVALSALGPPEFGREGSFPELLICAAVNVSDVGATPAGSHALSIVFTPHEVTVPAVPEARLETVALERFERPTRLGRGWGPAVNLSSAVAMTGAAVSPAMGKRTRGNLRALFAILNVRLGVWLPNPLDKGVRDSISTAEKRINVGLLGLVREMFGFHSERSSEIYVTDGGHYDNLGLVELMRRRCEEIWCIDASGDPPGRATALAEAILTAAGELGARVEIDLDEFARTAGAPFSMPELGATHASGLIHYADGSQASLTVVKLGITERTPSALREYRRTDRPFPHHSTVNQIYPAERFDAYRALGWASTQEALADPRTPTAAETRAATAGRSQPAPA